MLYFALLYIFGIVVAGDSSCPNVKWIKNLDWDSFTSGEWHYNRYYNTWEIGANCLTLTFNSTRDIYYVTGQKDDEPFSFRGFFVIRRNVGIMTVCSEVYLAFTGSGCLDLKVIFFNSTESTVFYHCSRNVDTGNIQEFIWGATRMPTLEGTAETRVENIFNSTNIFDPNKYIIVNQTDDLCERCDYDYDK